MYVKKLSFYLQDTECTVLYDHMPLDKFLKGKTENNKVNNLPTDCLSHLVDTKPTDHYHEPKGQEFRHTVFDELLHIWNTYDST